MKQRTSGRMTSRNSKVSGITSRKASASAHTPATPDSEAIAGHIKEFEYKARYSKNVLSKYQNLCRGDN